MLNLTSLIKFSENELLIWGQIERSNRTTEMDGKYIYMLSKALKVLKFVIKSNFYMKRAFTYKVMKLFYL